MKQKLKKIVILLALMVLVGSVFGEDVIRSKRIGFPSSHAGPG